MVIIFSILLGSVCFAEKQTNFGALKVFCELKGSDIYVDGKLAGRDSAEIEHIEVGTHYIKVESYGSTYFSNVVEIKANETTTIYAKGVSHQENARSTTKSSGPENNNEPSTASPFPFGIMLTYGNYNATISALGTSVTSPVTGNPVGLGIKFRRSLQNAESSYYYGGITYNTKVATTQLTYGYFGIGGRNDIAFAELGINYPSWKLDSFTVNGTFGYEFALGFDLTSNISIGAKYSILNGSFYDTTLGACEVNFTQTAAFISIN